MLPVLVTLIMQAAGGKALGRTVTIVAMPALLGPILGPLIGGAILTHLSWRFMFWVNVPFCAVGRAAGFAHLDVIIPLLAGIALIAAFTFYAPRRARPLVDVRLLVRRPVASASAVLFFSGFALYGAMLLLPLYYQQVRGVSALTTIPFAFAGAHANAWLLALSLVIRGFGLGAVTIPVMAVAYLGLDREQIAHSSVLTRTAQQLGGSFGTAVLAVILEQAVTAHHGRLPAAFGIAFWWSVGFSLVAVLLSLWLPGAQRDRQWPEPATASPVSLER